MKEKAIKVNEDQELSSESVASPRPAHESGLLLCPWCFNEPKLTIVEGSLTNPELVACDTQRCVLFEFAMTPEQWNERMARGMSDLQKQHEFDYRVALQETVESERRRLRHGAQSLAAHFVVGIYLLKRDEVLALFYNAETAELCVHDWRWIGWPLTNRTADLHWCERCGKEERLTVRGN